MTTPTISSINWANQTLADLSEAKKIIEANHPACALARYEFPEFHNWLDEGYEQAQQMAQSAQSIENYIGCMAFYLYGFNDGHLTFAPSPLEEYSWPGFLMTYQNKKFKVLRPINSEELNPPNNAEILSINGIPPENFIREHLFPYLKTDSQREAAWIQSTAVALVDLKRPEIPTIEKMTYLDSEEEEKTFVLENKKIDHPGLIKEIQRASFSVLNKFGVESFDQNGFWVSIPTFNDNSLDKEKQLENLVSKLPNLRNSSKIVFDLRGNGGGDSKWVIKIITALYGEDYLASQKHFKNMNAKIEVRATQKKLLAYEKLLDKKLDPVEKQEIEKEIEQMKQALKEDFPFYFREPDLNYFKRLLKRRIDPVSSPVKGTVYLLTDHHCFSTSLMFADILLSIPGTKHIGKPTDGDTVFSETMRFDLESKLGWLICPSLVKRNWERKNNETYIPSHLFTGSIENTEEVKHWVQQLS